MKQLVKYILVYPILTLIDLLDSLIGYFYLDAWASRRDRSLPRPDDVHSVTVHVTDTAVAYRSARAQENLFRLDDDEANVYEVVRKSAAVYADVNMLGYREVIAVEEEPTA